jgi:hypothetical protein
MSAGNCLGDNCRDYSRGTYHQYSGKAPGGAEMAWHRHRHYVETPAARRMRSLLRLPRRAFIGGMRYGEGRLRTKNAGDALR